ncbi:MAG: glycosyltransferase family 4 protein [Roseburia sp.]|nr:glycosyltransferase family 4 protein [Roseburia sp.]
MKRAVFITNIPSPYRVDFFSFLQKTYPEYEFHIIFSGAGMENRKWTVELEGLEHYHFLKSRTIIIRKRFDDRYVFLPVGVERTLREIAPELVFAMEYNPTILRAVHWCRKKKIPFISWTDGTLNSEKNIGKVQRLSRSYIVKRAAAFIASSTASKEAQIAYGAAPEKCFLSYLTVDIQKYLAKKDSYEARQLIYVGSLIQRKGLDLLLPALAQTSEDIRLVIVGEGQEKPLLEQQMKKLNLTERVEFKGYVEGEALRHLYMEADAFILPTREDCFGLVLLEAMCASLPVISSKYADGARDLIEEGKNGYIVDPEDTDAFAKTIERLFSEGRLREMGSYSYKKAQEFSFSNVAKGCISAMKYVEEN